MKTVVKIKYIRRPDQVEIVTAKRAGFCFGVKRAIDISFDIGKEIRKGVFTLGPIIHNPQVIEKLKAKGIFPLDDINDIYGKEINALIIRTHGIPHQLYDRISSQHFRLIDATCPFVKNAQHYAQQLKNNGYQVVVLGDESHPEVKGIMSYAGDDVVVVNEHTQLPRLKTKVGVVVQTTQPVETLKKLLANIIEHVKEVKVYNTICNSTALRLKETAEMAQKVDIMIVVGGKNSANTTQLSRLCESFAVKTYHIETDRELSKEWFVDAQKVGLTAGASTPDWIISKVEKRIRNIGGESSNGNE